MWEKARRVVAPTKTGADATLCSWAAEASLGPKPRPVVGSKVERGQSHVFFELSSFPNSWIMKYCHALPGSLENVDCVPLFSHSESSASMFVFLAEDPAN